MQGAEADPGFAQFRSRQLPIIYGAIARCDLVGRLRRRAVANVDIGDSAAAQAAYQVAARDGTVYYWQLARAELGEAGVSLRPLHAWQQSASLVARNEIVSAVRQPAGRGTGPVADPRPRESTQDLAPRGE
ncbi:hypothetical protein VW29_17290, partial [Devosia limi DSM 17137]